LKKNIRRPAVITLVAVVLVMSADSCVHPAPGPSRGPSPVAAATPSVAAPHVAFAGVRSSIYGIRPFPEPAAWGKAIQTMAGYYPGSTPVAVWIVGHLGRPRDCVLEFPGDGRAYPNIQFSEYDKHERYLEAFDRAGIKVFLQVEPANADMKTLIDLVLGRYGKHPCVIGLGVDVEWHREADRPKWGVPVDDAMGRQWEAWVKAHDPAYRLFIKHWDQRWLCPTYRGDIVFVDDSQIVESADVLVKEFEAWGKSFYPNPVMFQIGYPSDRPWWSQLPVPPKTLGERIAARVAQPCGIVWVDFTLREVLPVDHGLPDPVIGVKIYEQAAPFEPLVKEWRDLGINTVFASEALARTTSFRSLLRANAIALFIIYPIFQDPEALKARPALAAVTSQGLPARDDWVEFVCPSREDFIREKAERLRELVAATDPEAVSLDFIRDFVFWEKVYPDRSPASLPQTCFCSVCLERFARETGIAVPADLKTAPAAARWILGNRAAEWTDWKCGVIARAVETLAAAARRSKPGVLVNVHAVPWRANDFGGAIRSVAAQDASRLSRAADLLSPMTYHHMVLRTPAWVHDVVADLAQRSRAPILPSIQVAEAYIDQPLPPEEFRAALEEALKPPSWGVVLWNWDALSKSAEKKAILRAAAALKKPAR
jgi:hypothetical protein